MKKGVILFILASLILFSLLSFVSANFLQVTKEHPFFINNSWIPANQLKTGDILTTNDGKKAIITSIQDVKLSQPVQVFNIEDLFFHNYIVSQDNLIVHNSQSVNPQKSNFPRGFSNLEDYLKFSQEIHAEINKIEFPVNPSEVEVHGSSAIPGAGIPNDIDIAIRLTPSEWDSFVARIRQTINPNAQDYLKRFEGEVATEKINKYWISRLTPDTSFARDLKVLAGCKQWEGGIQISAVKPGGKFDRGPWIPVFK